MILCLLIRDSVGVDFQDELSDMLLLRMLQAGTKASADKDRVSQFKPPDTTKSSL